MQLSSHLTAARLVNHSYFHYNFSNKRTDVQIYCQDINSVRYLAIPGTYSVKDWLTNLKLNSLVTPYMGDGYRGKVKLHTGYYLGYLSVRESVLKFAETDLCLVVAGHSSGGCLAQIAGVDINYHLRKKVETVTFGSPACGNKYWAESARKRITSTSYVNFLDFVPYLLFFNYHVTSLIPNLNIYNNPHSIVNYVDSLK